ncbi:MAG TPA: DUF971 domain-containing protein [Terriglobales bacterium]|jgi:DUF971 family protein|nr:DUF971 domain-containing protein [Terriglobales bacterium]
MSRSAEPKSVEVQLASGLGVDIEWNDGHRSHYGFSYLRSVCPCAACSARRAAQGLQPGAARSWRLDDLGTLGAPVRALKAEPVGKYALRFHWDDGHRDGDYSWDFLREVCPCAACRAARDE